jgi:hypothetical protein
MPCPSHIPFLHHSNYMSIWRRVQVTQFFQSPVISFLFGPNILINTLFSNTLSVFGSCNIRDDVLHPYRTSSQIIVLYNLISTLFSRQEDKISRLNGSKYYPNSICSLFHHESNFVISLSLQKYLVLTIISKTLLAVFMS